MGAFLPWEAGDLQVLGEASLAMGARGRGLMATAGHEIAAEIQKIYIKYIKN